MLTTGQNDWTCMIRGAWLLIAVTFAPLATAQTPRVNYLHHSNMPPGVVGQQQLLRRGGLAGYFQAVELLAPDGMQVSVMNGGQFESPRPMPVLLGMQIGYVYHFKLMNIPSREGLEIYPTVELVNRLYPPEGAKLRFPVPIEFTMEEIELALAGQYVTRVVYLEDPSNALPQRDDPDHQRVIEASPKEDPLHVADRLGRPMAIVRMGSRVPEDHELLAPGCVSPPLLFYTAPKKTLPVTPKPVANAIERYGQDEPRTRIDDGR